MKDIVTIVALFVGPMAAVLTQLWFENRREVRRQKLWVFTTLMATRRTVLSGDFIRALNSIEVVFFKNKTVRSRFKELLRHLTIPEWKQVPIPPDILEKTRDLIAQLLAEMAKELHYSYDHTELKDDAYSPQGIADQEEEFRNIRAHLIPVLSGRQPIGVTLHETVADYHPTLKPLTPPPGGFGRL